MLPSIFEIFCRRRLLLFSSRGRESILPASGAHFVRLSTNPFRPCRLPRRSNFILSPPFDDSELQMAHYAFLIFILKFCKCSPLGNGPNTSATFGNIPRLCLLSDFYSRSNGRTDARMDGQSAAARPTVELDADKAPLHSQMERRYSSRPPAPNPTDGGHP